MLNWKRVWTCFRLWHVMLVHLKPCRLIQFIRFCSAYFVHSPFWRNAAKVRSIWLHQFTPSSEPPQNATSRFGNQQLDKAFKLYIFPWFIVNCWIVPIETVFSLSHPVIFTKSEKWFYGQNMMLMQRICRLPMLSLWSFDSHYIQCVKIIRESLSYMICVVSVVGSNDWTLFSNHKSFC